jgi:hypothetical protein
LESLPNVGGEIACSSQTLSLGQLDYSNMLPAGYMAKRVRKRPDWLAATQVIDIYSVSSCHSENFADYIPYWKHNGYWFFDSPKLARLQHAGKLAFALADGQDFLGIIPVERDRRVRAFFVIVIIVFILVEGSLSVRAAIDSQFNWVRWFLS